MRHNGGALLAGLGDEEPVEGITMVQGKRLDVRAGVSTCFQGGGEVIGKLVTMTMTLISGNSDMLSHMEIRTIQLRSRGALTLPARLRERHGLHEGDPLTLVDLDGVFVLSPKVGVVGKLAREIEYLRQESGLSLDELIKSVREERARYHLRRGGPVVQEES